MGNKFSSWKRNKGSNARIVMTSQDPLVISLMSNTFKDDAGKESERKPLLYTCLIICLKIPGHTR